MTIIYRHVKGAPLSAAEVDQNFADLDSRMAQLESLFGTPQGIAKIEQDGTHITIVGNNGAQLAQLEWPMPPFAPKGQWKEKDEYKVGDVVQNPSLPHIDLIEHPEPTHLNVALYYCIVPHVSTHFERDKEQGYWQMLLDLHHQ